MALFFKILLRVWKKQSKTAKVLLVLLMLVSIYAVGRTVQSAIYKYKYFKQVEKEYKTLKEQIELTEAEEQKVITKTKIRTKSVQKKNIEIDKKLKEDEKVINNSDTTDDELQRYISKHQKR